MQIKIFSAQRQGGFVIEHWQCMHTSMKNMTDELQICNNILLNTLVKKHSSVITSSHHFTSSHLQCETRAERGKESVAQRKYTHFQTRIRSNSIFKLQRTQKNRIHLPHFTVEEARCSTGFNC